MKKKTLSLLLLCALLVGCSRRAPEPEPIAYPIEASGSVGDEQPVSRAVVAKMLAHTLEPAVAIYSMDDYINFHDVSDTSWYHPYVNVVYTHGIMSGEGQTFAPAAPLTLVQAQYILNNLAADTAINVTPDNQHLPISFALWNQIFQRALQDLSGDASVAEHFDIHEQTLVILATEKNNPLLAGGYVMTNRGLFVSAGLDNNSFLDKEISVLTRGQDLISVLEVVNMSPTLTHGFVTGVASDSLSVFIGGVERVFSADIAPRASYGDIVSVQIHAGQLLSYQLYDKAVTGTTIERVTWGAIELFGHGRVALSPNFVVYNNVGVVSLATPRDLVVGTEIARFVWGEDQSYLIAAVIEHTPSPRYLRVALNTTGFTSLVHDYIELTADIGFTIRDSSGTSSFYPGEVARFEQASDISGYRAYIETKGEGRIQILSIARQWPGGVSPKYHGSMQVAWEENGFSLVNVVPMEKYLQAVVPSEMPSSFGLEASMLQAVTARSYAYGQFLANRQAHLGANVEDSVMSQVYNNIPENDISIQAVNNTRGQVVAYQGQVISTNFFSTSAGMTANSGDVWALHNRLPAETPTFLQSVQQHTGESFGDLSDEAVARAFFNNRELDAYDNISPWFRWDVTMSAEQVAHSINSNLQARFDANPYLIKTLDTDGEFRSLPFRAKIAGLEDIPQACACGGLNAFCIYGIGELMDIRVASRGAGGNIMELIVEGTEATVKIITEFNIRTLLAPRTADGIVTLNRWDGSSLNNFSMMPSSFFTIERLTDHDGRIVDVRFIGGGFGHGAGMSQYGARGMLLRGYNYLEILLHFYTGVDIITLY